MPTNLKSLLSRSRSRNELKGKGTTEEKVQSMPPMQSSYSCCCPDNEVYLTDQCTSPQGIVLRSQLGIHDHPPTCQCQLTTIKSTMSESLENISNPQLNSPSDCESLQCHHYEPNSASLVSVISPTQKLFTIGPPLGNNSTNPSPYNSPCHLPSVSTPCHTIRKCETVLGLSTVVPSTSSSSSSSNGSHLQNSTFSEGGRILPGTLASNRVKMMKNRILSTSSSALSSLFQSKTTTTNKLLLGWKLSTTKSSSHQLQSSSPKFLESLPNQLSPVLIHPDDFSHRPLTPINRLRRHGSIANSLYPRSLSRQSSIGSVTLPQVIDDSQHFISCPLCLSDVKVEDTLEISACSCRYCKDCLIAYITFEIGEGTYEIACPMGECEKQGILSLPEIEILVAPYVFDKHQKFRLFKEVETNCELMWCPTAGCETICKIQDPESGSETPKIQCPTCEHVYCATCHLPIHPELTCELHRKNLILEGKLNVLDNEPWANLETIKKCPFCCIPIEKDSGCAQMMCKQCKHVFCWYCLTSLDDDFLLRHYDKGPCKNKLGHSRASVVWHRAQVIGIFAGFGVLVLIASPLLILAAPCLLCCRCKYCSTASTVDSDDFLPI